MLIISVHIFIFMNTPPPFSPLVLVCEEPALFDYATYLADTFHLVQQTQTDNLYFFKLTAEKLGLYKNEKNAGVVSVDFITGKAAHRRQFGGGRKQPLGRALGLKTGYQPFVLDATAGLGRDAFVMTCLGCKVQMLERSPVTAALLYDGLRRAQADIELGHFIHEQLHFAHIDAITWLNQREDLPLPDVIYLDPMYPQRQKSALVKKEMLYLHSLIGQDTDTAEVLACACEYAQQRVVVKRPKGADFLGHISPTVSIHSKNTRYDVYSTRAGKV